MKSFINSAKEFIRNPLGIIGLFISLIYGIMALVLTNVIKTLVAGLQIALISFIILFPILILFTFLYLVIKHHEKLYAPKDFRSDNAFYGEPLTTTEINKKYEQEIAQQKEEPEELDEEKQEHDEDNNIPLAGGFGRSDRKASQEKKKQDDAFEESAKQKAKTRKEVKEEYILLEELAIKKLELDRKMLVNRKVKVLFEGEEFWVDGMGTKGGLKFIVEVKIIKGDLVSKEIAEDIIRFRNILRYNERLKLIFVFVFDKGKGKGIQESAFSILNMKVGDVSYIYYTKEALLKEFVN